MQFRTLLVTVSVCLFIGGIGSTARGQTPPFELAVKQDETFGSTAGVLVFSDDGVEFRPTGGQPRRWPYADLKQVQVLSPTRIRLRTYEDRGWTRLGADRDIRYEVVQGAIASELTAFLMARIDRSTVTAVVPASLGQPLARVLVRHERGGRGSIGALVMYETGLAYETERGGEARFWRFMDIASVLKMDPWNLEITAYEGGGGRLRPFTFEARTGLPAGFYDVLWARVNPSPLATARGSAPR